MKGPSFFLKACFLLVLILHFCLKDTWSYTYWVYSVPMTFRWQLIPPFFFSVEINDEVKRHAALLRENDPLLIDKNLLLICHEVAP